MAVLRLQVNDGTSFLVHWLHNTALDIAAICEMVAGKLRSPLVFCPRCPEGHHPEETICFPPQAVDSTTLAIMVQLLEGRTIEPKHFPFPEVCAVAQYLIIEEDYLAPYLLDYMTDEETCQSPSTFKGIESLYVAQYQNLAKHLYILACSHSPPQTLQMAYEIFPDLFQETDFFWG